MYQKIVRFSYTLIVCLILYALLLYTRYIINYPQIFHIVDKVDFYLSVLSVLVCIIVFYVFMNGINLKAESVLAYLGRKYSMPVYILHNLFVLQFVAVGSFILCQI